MTKSYNDQQKKILQKVWNNKILIWNKLKMLSGLKYKSKVTQPIITNVKMRHSVQTEEFFLKSYISHNKVGNLREV